MRVKDNGQRNFWPAQSKAAKAELARIFGQRFEVRHKRTHAKTGTLTVLHGVAVPPPGHYLVSL